MSANALRDHFALSVSNARRVARRHNDWQVYLAINTQYICHPDLCARMCLANACAMRTRTNKSRHMICIHRTRGSRTRCATIRTHLQHILCAHRAWGSCSLSAAGSNVQSHTNTTNCGDARAIPIISLCHSMLTRSSPPSVSTWPVLFFVFSFHPFRKLLCEQGDRSVRTFFVSSHSFSFTIIIQCQRQ